MLDRYPTATHWQIGTTDEYDDGWYFDESNVQVDYVDSSGQPATAVLDLSRTPAADDLRDVADESTLGWGVTMSVDMRPKAQP